MTESNPPAQPEDLRRRILFTWGKHKAEVVIILTYMKWLMP
jgi:hypothetical protein